MKATLAMLACLSMVGFLSAAEVTGNNTAVVIQKTAVKANGWQFVCVPVDALDITDSMTAEEKNNADIALATILPPTLYTNGTTVREVGGDGTPTQLVGGVWGDGKKTVKPGTILWIKDPATPPTALLSGTATSTNTAAIVFCGQDRTRTASARPTEGLMTALKNDGSVAISLDDAISGDPNKGDEIYVLKDGSSEYKVYRYTKRLGEDANFANRWLDLENLNKDMSTETPIAAGEAYYYFAASSN